VATLQIEFHTWQVLYTRSIIGWVDLSLEVINSYEVTQVKLQLPNKWCEISRNKVDFVDEFKAFITSSTVGFTYIFDVNKTWVCSSQIHGLNLQHALMFTITIPRFFFCLDIA
jgi:hypothetical protein